MASVFEDILKKKLGTPEPGSSPSNGAEAPGAGLSEADKEKVREFLRSKSITPPQKKRSIVKKSTNNNGFGNSGSGNDGQQSSGSNVYSELSKYLSATPVSTSKLRQLVEQGSVHKESVAIYLKSVTDCIVRYNQTEKFKKSDATDKHVICISNIVYLQTVGMVTESQNENTLAEMFRAASYNDDERLSANGRASELILQQIKQSGVYDKIDYNIIFNKLMTWSNDKEVLLDGIRITNGLANTKEAALSEQDKYNNLQQMIRLYSEPSFGNQFEASGYTTNKSKSSFGPIISKARQGQEIYNIEKAIEMDLDCMVVESKAMTGLFNTLKGYDHNCLVLWKPVLKAIAKRFGNRLTLVRKMSIIGSTVSVNGMPVMLNNEMQSYLDDIGLTLSSTANFDLILKELPYIETLNLDEEAYEQLRYEYIDENSSLTEEKQLWNNLMLPHRKLKKITVMTDGNNIEIDRAKFRELANSEEYKQYKDTKKAENVFKSACGLLNPNLHSRPVGDQVEVFKALSKGAYGNAMSATEAWGKTFDLLVSDNSISFKKALGIGALATVGTTVGIAAGTVFGAAGLLGSMVKGIFRVFRK